MYIDKFWNEKEQAYQLEDDSWCNTPIEVMISIFNFCGCGRPEDALQYVKNVLNVLWDSNSDITVSRERRKKFFENQHIGIDYFTYYIFDNIGLIEHGSSVPGWLTPFGKDIRDDLNEILKGDD